MTKTCIEAERLVVLNVDGLRPDCLRAELESASLPHLTRLLGADSEHREAALAALCPTVSTAPSITFCAQASIVTGASPAEHGISGNDFFDRSGEILGGGPRHFGFDVGDTYAVNDAVSVFSGARLADRVLRSSVETLYESVRKVGGNSLVAHSMYSRGAQHVLSPSLVQLARMTKLRGWLGLRRGEFDENMLTKLDATLRGPIGSDLTRSTSPAAISLYFMGLDKESHEAGPHTQRSYLRDVLDAQIGRTFELLRKHNLLDGTLFALISDHGQSATTGDDAHTVRLGFPFDRELSKFFHALHLDVHDIPGEDPHVDAVVGLNGGLAHVFLRHPHERCWSVAPRFEEDVLRVAHAFARMNTHGEYCPELRGTLETILVRDPASNQYQVLQSSGEGKLLSLKDYYQSDPVMAKRYPDAAARLNALNGVTSGDIILIANSERGVYFGKPGMRGVHGGLHADDSFTCMALSMPSAGPAGSQSVSERFQASVRERAHAEGRQFGSITDLVTSLRALWSRLVPNEHS